MAQLGQYKVMGSIEEGGEEVGGVPGWGKDRRVGKEIRGWDLSLSRTKSYSLATNGNPGLLGSVPPF